MNTPQHYTLGKALDRIAQLEQAVGRLENKQEELLGIDKECTELRRKLLASNAALRAAYLAEDSDFHGGTRNAFCRFFADHMPAIDAAIGRNRLTPIK